MPRIDRSRMICPRCGEDVSRRQLKRHQNGEPCRAATFNAEQKRQGFRYTLHGRMKELFEELEIETRQRPGNHAAIFWGPEWAILWVEHMQAIEATDKATVNLLVGGLRAMKDDARLRGVILSLLAAWTPHTSAISVGGINALTADHGTLVQDTPATEYLRAELCAKCFGIGGLPPLLLKIDYIESCARCASTGRRKEQSRGRAKA